MNIESLLGFYLKNTCQFTWILAKKNNILARNIKANKKNANKKNAKKKNESIVVNIDLCLPG